MRECTLCKRIHIGSLVFATKGFLTVFRSEWEQNCCEEDLDHQLRNQVPAFKRSAPHNLVRFIELVNAVS